MSESAVRSLSALQEILYHRIGCLSSTFSKKAKKAGMPLENAAAVDSNFKFCYNNNGNL